MKPFTFSVNSVTTCLIFDAFPIVKVSLKILLARNVHCEPFEALIFNCTRTLSKGNERDTSDPTQTVSFGHFSSNELTSRDGLVGGRPFFRFQSSQQRMLRRQRVTVHKLK